MNIELSFLSFLLYHTRYLKTRFFINQNIKIHLITSQSKFSQIFSIVKNEKSLNGLYSEIMILINVHKHQIIHDYEDYEIIIS